MPRKRPYRLGKRQASVDETRNRIIEAAVEEYQEHGIDDTTMVAVARRADVAPGTVLYHYPDPAALGKAVVDRWIAEADLPDPPVVDTDLPVDEKAGVLVEAVLQRHDRDHPAARIYIRNPNHPAMVELRRTWDDWLSEVVTATIGSHLEDRDRPVIEALLSGQFIASLSQRGIHGAELRQTVIRLVAASLASRT